MQTMPARTRKMMTVGAIVLGLAIVGGAALYSNRDKTPTTQTTGERPMAQEPGGTQTQEPLTSTPLTGSMPAAEEGTKAPDATETPTGTSATAAPMDGTATAAPAGAMTPAEDGSDAAMAGADVPEEYKVEAGDSLRGIALKFYGDPIHFADIEELNELKDPDHITAGLVLKMPRPESLKH